MEASTLQPPATLSRPRIALGPPLLRLRSDEQLVALFRAGHDEAFRAIHDRYHKRLFAYARQMLPGRQDAEDALQDVFVRAYSGLRASDRELALRAWLFRVAHNRCIDELRKPTPPPPEVLQLVRSAAHDPLTEMDARESLRRLVEDIRRLPDQQRSALLMRELVGMTYAELASSLGVSVGAVKSLLVRARLALAQAAAARDTACAVIREELVEAHDRGIRPNANARKHMRDCSCCKSFRRELRGVSRQLAATAPAIGPLTFLAKLIGLSGGGGAAGGAGGGAALLSGGGTTASAGGLALSTGHVATLIVAAVATAGGAVEIQHTIIPPVHRAAHVSVAPGRSQPADAPVQPGAASNTQAAAGVTSDTLGRAPRVDLAGSSAATTTAASRHARAGAATNADDPAAATTPGSTKRHSLSASSKTGAGSTATGTSAAGCAAAGGSVPAGTSNVGSTGTTGSTTTSGTDTSTSSGSAPPASTAACSSTASSSSKASGSSTETTSSGSGSVAGSGGNTSTDSSSAGAGDSASGTGTSQTSSNVTTG